MSREALPLLVLMRHGQAEPYRIDDAGRALVAPGVAEVQRSADYLRQLGIRPNLLMSSPYLRARQTAVTVMDQLQLSLELKLEPCLQPDEDPVHAASLLTALMDSATERRQRSGSMPAEAEVLLAATHMPMIAGLLRSLTGIEQAFSTGSLVVLSRQRSSAAPYDWQLQHRYDPAAAR